MALARGRLSRQDGDEWLDVQLSGSAGDFRASKSRLQGPSDGDDVGSVVSSGGCSDGCSNDGGTVQDHGETVELSRAPTTTLMQGRHNSRFEACPC